MSGYLHQSLDIIIREVERSDQGYIAATWWRSMLGTNRAPRRRRMLNDQIDRVLDDKSTRALVACPSSDPDRILGWLVYSSAPVARVVFYIYVRDEERDRGIARRLIAAAWPGSDSRLVLTMKGPSTAGFLAKNKNVSFCPLEEFLR